MAGGSCNFIQHFVGCYSTAQCYCKAVSDTCGCIVSELWCLPRRPNCSNKTKLCHMLPAEKPALHTSIREEEKDSVSYK